MDVEWGFACVREVPEAWVYRALLHYASFPQEPTAHNLFSLNSLLRIFQSTWGDVNSGPKTPRSSVLPAKFQERLPILCDLT